MTAMRQRRLPPDKQALVEQFLKLSPAERLRQAFGMADFVIRINPNLLAARRKIATPERRTQGR